jgi:predicted hydrocarbon binding protein
MLKRREKLGREAAVKGTMLQAHLVWAEEKLGAGYLEKLRGLLDPEAFAYVNRSVLATDWIPFWALIQVDRAIAKAVGGDSDKSFFDLGRHSATINLKGAYKNFVAGEPHRFFEQMALLHGRFQNFGKSAYENAGPSVGRIRIEGYTEYSPVFCASGRGYYEGALHMMNAPGPISSVETSCQCAGDAVCLYELRW